MIFENYAVQYREWQVLPNLIRERHATGIPRFIGDSTQFEPIWRTNFSYSSISRTRKNNKHLSVGQMVVNNEGQIVSLNQKFISIWKLTQPIVTARCERQVIQFIAEQLENPPHFLFDIRNVREQRLLEIQELIKLKDGRTFSYIMKPQWLEREIVGRIYRFQLVEI